MSPIMSMIFYKAIKKLLNRVGVNNIDRLFKLQIADTMGSTKRNNIDDVLDIARSVDRILNKKEPLSIKDLKINGEDLINLGVPQGKQIGMILNELMEIILDNPELNTKEDLLEIVQDKLTNLSRL